MTVKILPQKKTTNSTTALFVALYLVILAFFILLNTISESDHNKSKEGIESIQQSFSGNPQITLVNSKIFNNIDNVDSIFNTKIAMLKTLVEDYFAIEDIITKKHGDTLYISMPQSALFQPNTVKIRNEKHEFIERLTSILINTPPNTTNEIYFSIGKAYMQQSNQDISLEINRIEQFVQLMLKNKIKKQNILSGIRENKIDQIIMTLTLKSANNT